MPFTLIATKYRSIGLAPTNSVFMNPEDIRIYGLKTGFLRYKREKLEDIWTVLPDNKQEIGTISLGSYHRISNMIELGQTLSLEEYFLENFTDEILLEVTGEISFQVESKIRPFTIDYSEFIETVKANWSSLYIQKNRKNYIVYQQIGFTIQFLQLQTPKGKVDRGLFTSKTVFHLVTQIPQIQINGTASFPEPLIRGSWNLEALGVGGLSKEMNIFFRRAFASRLVPPQVARQLGVKHVKGVLLHGPPGTGKTLIARAFGKILNAHEPIIVNGPDLLNKYVGESEANVRKLFQPAEEEFREKGDKSRLHIIVLDEFDTLVRSRGASQSSIGDGVVNQFLAKIDGYHELNNLLLIGMTNRLDLIDEGIRRPGRFEVEIEIGLPDATGRVEILKIHTATMRKNGRIDPNVSLETLSIQTVNFTGAELEGLVKAAVSHALREQIDPTNLDQEVKADSILVNNNHFTLAFRDIRPRFGRTDRLDEPTKNVCFFSSYLTEGICKGEGLIRQVDQITPLMTVLLTGDHRAGKKTIAYRLCQTSGFPSVQRIRNQDLTGLSDQKIGQKIQDIFTDAHRSVRSIIVIEKIEEIFGYVPIGPAYSLSILLTLKNLLVEKPKNGHHCLIFVTTNNRLLLEKFDLLHLFHTTLHVPSIVGPDQAFSVLQASDLQGLLPDQIKKQISQEVRGEIAYGTFIQILQFILSELKTVQERGDILSDQTYLNLFQKGLLTYV